jgi:hypothetical protein
MVAPVARQPWCHITPLVTPPEKCCHIHGRVVVCPSYGDIHCGAGTCVCTLHIGTPSGGTKMGWQEWNFWVTRQRVSYGDCRLELV